MPKLFLSPSTQEYNPYVDGGNEEYYMNLVADAMEPYLDASGIMYVRNDTAGTVKNSIARSNAGDYDFHLAIHSNASPPQSAGRNRGVQVYYYSGSEKGRRAAEIIAENYKRIYPLPETVRTVATTSLAELKGTRAPAVLIETAFHDNPEDARWIRENIGEIAENLAQSTAQILGVPFEQLRPVRTAMVNTRFSALNLREGPSVNSRVIDRIPNGTLIPVIGRDGEWYLTKFNGKQGYVSGEYILLE